MHMNIFNRFSSKERYPVLWLVFATYLLLLAARVVDATLLDRGNEYFSIILLELLIFVLPSAVYLYFRRRSIAREAENSPKNQATESLPANKNSSFITRPVTPLSLRALRIRIPRTSHILLIISATLALITGGLLLSIVFGNIDSLGSSFSLYDTFISKNNSSTGSTLYLIFVFALLPAICEEFLFRSLLCSEIEASGALPALLISSLFFGLLHFNLSLLPLYIYSGLLLALTMYISRSVITAVMVHFLYNLFGIFSRSRVAVFYKTTGSLGLFMSILVILFLLSVSLFCFSAGRLYRRYAERNLNPRHPVGQSPLKTGRALLSVISSPPAILCIVVFILTIIIFR